VRSDSTKVLMKCGHVAQGVEVGTGRPVCVICAGNPNAYIPVPENEIPSLVGRKSKCSYCNSVTDSDYSLPFFEHKPKEPFDAHYDGCWGWD